MTSFPLPVRVAAGLAVFAAEQIRELPKHVAGLPVTVASQAMQISMRLQQQVTELAIKGDEALAGLQPATDTPEWATFDEDLVTEAARSDVEDPWTAEEQATQRAAQEAGAFSTQETDIGPGNAQSRTSSHIEQTEPAKQTGPGGLANYDSLTFSQLRARLRPLSIDQLAELVDYERAHANREPIVDMVQRRIRTLTKQANTAIAGDAETP